MTKKLTRLGTIGATIAASALPWLVAAQAPPPVPPSPITSVGGVVGIMCTIFFWLFTFLIILAIIFVIVAAFKYLTAAGDPEKVKGANRQLIYAAVAVVVALIARGFPFIVGTFIGAGRFTGC